MKVYVVSVGAGVLVGVIYGLLGVRSPAPPLVALAGLLGILLGEQAAAIGQRIVRGQKITTSWVASECAPRITGVAPPSPSTDSPSSSDE